MAEKPEDLNLPNAVITRLVKEVLPNGCSLSKEARSAISKSASVFVLYLTSCANNLVQKNKRKTMTANDVLEALEEMEFQQFLEPLQKALEAFKKEQSEKKVAAEKRKQNKETLATEEEEETAAKKTTPEDEQPNDVNDDDETMEENAEKSDEADDETKEEDASTEEVNTNGES